MPCAKSCPPIGASSKPEGIAVETHDLRQAVRRPRDPDLGDGHSVVGASVLHLPSSRSFTRRYGRVRPVFAPHAPPMAPPTNGTSSARMPERLRIVARL